MFLPVVALKNGFGVLAEELSCPCCEIVLPKKIVVGDNSRELFCPLVGEIRHSDELSSASWDGRVVKGSGG